MLLCATVRFCSWIYIYDREPDRNLDEMMGEMKDAGLDHICINLDKLFGI